MDVDVSVIELETDGLDVVVNVGRGVLVVDIDPLLLLVVLNVITVETSGRTRFTT